MEALHNLNPLLHKGIGIYNLYNAANWLEGVKRVYLLRRFLSCLPMFHHLLLHMFRLGNLPGRWKRFILPFPGNHQAHKSKSKFFPYGLLCSPLPPPIQKLTASWVLGPAMLGMFFYCPELLRQYAKNLLLPL